MIESKESPRIAPLPDREPPKDERWISIEDRYPDWNDFRDGYQPSRDDSGMIHSIPVLTRDRRGNLDVACFISNPTLSGPRTPFFDKIGLSPDMKEWFSERVRYWMPIPN